MKFRDIYASLGLAALVVVLVSAASRGGGGESRPMVIQKGVTITTVDRSSGSQNPISYSVDEADGPWLKVTLLKKSSKTKKGDPFWLKVDDIGAFVIE